MLDYQRYCRAMATRIFLVDMDEGARFGFIRSLEGSKYAVVDEVRTLEDAIEQYPKWNPSIIIFPVVAGTRDVVEVIKRLHQSNCHARLAVTYDSRTAQRLMEGYRQGVSASIKKPFDRHRVLATLALLEHYISEPAHTNPVALLPKPLIVECTILRGLFRRKLICSTRKIGPSGLDLRSEKYIRQGQPVSLIIRFPHQDPISVKGQVSATVEQVKGSLYELFVSFVDLEREVLDAILGGIAEMIVRE